MFRCHWQFAAAPRTRHGQCIFSVILAVLATFSPTLAPAAAAPTAHPAQQYREGEVLVTFKPSVSLPAAQQALGRHSLNFAKHFAFLSQRRGRQSGLVRDHKRTTASLIAELSKDAAVEVAEPNYLRWTASSQPNDPLFPQMWGLQNTGQPVYGVGGTAGDDIKHLPAWAMARPSTNPVIVAVIDTGVDYHHPDLAPNMWTNAAVNPTNGIDSYSNDYTNDYYGYDFADNVGDPMDSGFHGTHVSGTIAAAGNNLLGVIGVDYQARIMALKASSDGNTLSSSAIIEAIQYATMMKTNGVNVAVINASFGGGGYVTQEAGAIQEAGDAGIVFCAAANNNGNNLDYTSDYPASYRLSNMIVVAATDCNDALASFSDYGPSTVDLGAPGVGILSTTPTNQPGVTSYVLQGATTDSANALTYAGTTPGITATVYDCGLGYPTNFPPTVSNNIALISRGTLYFSDKVANAVAAGAVAAIIYNNASGNFYGSLQVASNWIPAVSISQADGLALQALLPVTATVASFVDPANIYQFLDGTSMAAPHVSGAVAFAAMNFPNETVAQRIQRILSNVDVVPGLQGLVITGGRLNLLRTVDTDVNGLPDWWEQMYFGQLTGTDPNADPDHDDFSNLDEWLAGTNPTNSASCLRLLIPWSNPTYGWACKWPSVSGRTYRLECSTNFLNGFNVVVRTNIAATPPFNVVWDTNALPASAHYYRVRLEQ